MEDRYAAENVKEKVSYYFLSAWFYSAESCKEEKRLFVDFVVLEKEIDCIAF